MQEYLGEIIFAVVGLISATTVYYRQKAKVLVAKEEAILAGKEAKLAKHQEEFSKSKVRSLIIQAEENSKIMLIIEKNFREAKEDHAKLRATYETVELDLNESKEIIKNFGKNSTTRRKR